MGRFGLTYIFFKNILFSSELNAYPPLPTPVLTFAFPGSIAKIHKEQDELFIHCCPWINWNYFKVFSLQSCSLKTLSNH